MCIKESWDVREGTHYFNEILLLSLFNFISVSFTIIFMESLIKNFIHLGILNSFKTGVHGHRRRRST